MLRSNGIWRNKRVNSFRISLVFVLLAAWNPSARAYSVLTHEAVVDAAWDRFIQPLLLQRFPGATPEDLRKSHAFAYGGCIIQDLGYYPLAANYLVTWCIMSQRRLRQGPDS
jgi:hypothetical protein